MAAGVILAAGAGTRLGGVAKALLRDGDGTFLQRILQTLRADGGPVVVVVAAPFGEQVAAHAREIDREVVIVNNPDPARGMASSIALGFAALQRSSEVDAAYLWPVDHPYVSQATLAMLAAAIGSHDVARPIYRHHGTVRGGHPPLIARRCWNQLAVCNQIEGGARAVISKLDVVDVAVDDSGVVRDIDTPEDRGS